MANGISEPAKNRGIQFRRRCRKRSPVEPASRRSVLASRQNICLSQPFSVGGNRPGQGSQSNPVKPGQTRSNRFRWSNYRSESRANP